jgi:hypothetical protein
MVYSGHDTTLASLLTALGFQTNVDRGGYVPFASALLVELWRRSGSLGTRGYLFLPVLFLAKSFFLNYLRIANINYLTQIL